MSRNMTKNLSISSEKEGSTWPLGEVKDFSPGAPSSPRLACGLNRSFFPQSCTWPSVPTAGRCSSDVEGEKPADSCEGWVSDRADLVKRKAGR